ncbi:MAG: alpha-ribazole phosphatase [Chloroflexota bacterium]
MTSVYVLRHPETTWNVAHRYQGRLESPPSDRGKGQARLAAEAFRNTDVEAVYSSPLHRARYLAGHVSDVTQCPVYVDQRLTEIGQGVWEGLYLPEITARYAELHARWYSEPEAVTFPYGENLTSIQKRVASVFADLVKWHPHSAVVLVAHSVAIQVLVCSALGLDLRHIHNLHVSNTGATVFCGDRVEGSLLTLNALDGVHGSTVAAVSAENCVSWKSRREVS